MTQEDKQLLLKDLCGRLPYGVICAVEFKDGEGWKIQNMSLEGVFIDECYFTTDTGSIYSKEYKPYLCPMSSMTEEERKEVNSIIFKYSKHSEYFTFSYNARGIIYNGNDNCCCINIGDSTIDGLIDWLNEHHFDYRNLIEKGLAIEVTEENNPYKE